MVAVVLLPAFSWLDGSGQLAWTMMSRVGQYRLEVRALDDAGGVVRVPPSRMAAAAGRTAAARMLFGADVWRTHDVSRFTLRRNLDALAPLACAVAPGALAVELTLHERAHRRAGERATTTRRTCAR